MRKLLKRLGRFADERGAATKFGGEIMRMDTELGLSREGFPAGRLLVDGNPLADIRVPLDQKRLIAIMKDGKFDTAPSNPRL